MTEDAQDRPAPPGGADDALQREINEALGGRSIEDLLDEAEALPRPRARRRGRAVAVGNIVPARVVAVDDQVVLMELGAKDQGYVPLEQFERPPEAGDILQLEVVRHDQEEDLWVLSREGAVERATWDDLSVGQIVEAFVENVNKGGLEVRFGGVHGFMPLSQISLYRVETPEEYLHQKLRCQVIEVDRRENRVIVSARALMELEAQQKREALLEELAEGDIRSGVVRQVMPYGAFVDLGGVDGLLHVSQMSWSRVADPGDVVQPGQTVSVKVLKIEDEGRKISLGMKQTQPDPWESVEKDYPLGSLAAGRVTKLERFGAFVELQPGVEALIPLSELAWQRVGRSSDVLQAGQEVQAVVLSVDPGRRRLSLSLKQAQANPWVGVTHKYPRQSEHTGTVTRLAEFGAFVELEPGVEGLVHISELSDQRVRRVEDVVQQGQPLRVRVLDVDEPARRISLSSKALLATETPDRPARAAKKRKRPLRGGLD